MSQITQALLTISVAANAFATLPDGANRDINIRYDHVRFNKNETPGGVYRQHFASIARSGEVFCGYKLENLNDGNSYNVQTGVEVLKDFRGAVAHINLPENEHMSAAAHMTYTFRFINGDFVQSVAPNVVKCEDGEWQMTSFNTPPASNARLPGYRLPNPQQCLGANGVGYICPNQPGGTYYQTPSVTIYPRP